MDDLNEREHQFQELLVLYKVAQAGTEATNIDRLIEQALYLLGETFPAQIDFGIGLIDWRAGHVNGYTCLRGHQEMRVFPDSCPKKPYPTGRLFSHCLMTVP